MERGSDEPLIEVTGAESAKFTAPLLLLHGLWVTAVVWRRWAGFLAHRGWSCHALNLRGRLGAAPATRWQDYEDDVRRAAARLEAPPVIIGHDLGGLLALRAAAAARAVVALAPRVPRPYWPSPAPDLKRPGVRLSLLLNRAVAAPHGAQRVAYCHDPTLPLVPEPTGVVRTLMREELLIPVTTTPVLIVSGGRDTLVPVAAAESLARHAGATLRVDADAGHALMTEAGWERRAGEVHRWIIHCLGDPLLALREESEVDEEHWP